MSDDASHHHRVADPGEPVTVVIASSNRPGVLARSLPAVLALDHPELRVIVVDSAPADDATAQLVEELSTGDPRLSYLCEPEPGLARARNRGLDGARTALVVFLDDDVVPAPDHLDRLCAPFAGRPDVWCVAGPVRPAESDPRPPGGARRELRRRAGPGPGPLFAPIAARLVRRGNLAFRTHRLRARRGFDVRLGPGTTSRGGDELDVIDRLVRAGGVVVHEPGAAATRLPIAGDGAEQQLADDRAGLGAAVTKRLLDPLAALGCLVRLPFGAGSAWSHGDEPSADAGDPASRRGRSGTRPLAAGALGYLDSLVRGGRRAREHASGSPS